MSSDEITWQIIAHQHCAYKLSLSNKTQTFCRNEHNLTGFCTRQSCPLANSRYATVRPDPATGALYLYLKTPERNHLPSQWWEKIQLPQNYEKALAAIDEKLLYWSKFSIHKCKQRLTRLTQVAIRERRIAKESERLGEKLVPRLASKVKRREETRERKAESAAKVERAIERELIERLRSGAYGDKPLNVQEGIWKKVMRGLERAEKGEDLEEDEEDQEEEQERELELEVEYVSDVEESEAGEMEDFDDWLGEEDEDDEDDDSDDEDRQDSDASDTGEGSGDSDDTDDASDTKRKAGGKRKRGAPPSKSANKKKPKMEIEYEFEGPTRERELAV